MSPQEIVQLCVAIALICMTVYFIYKNNQIEKKYADKPTKNK